MDGSDRWDFHRLEPWQFEELAASVLETKYNIQLVSFSKGKDGGRDAVARETSILVDQDRILNGQNVVLQAKHTRKINNILDDGHRRLIFKPELKKVKTLVQNDELDVYIVVMNYGIPAGQEEKIVKSFKACGAQHVIVVGRETLIRWIKGSRELNKKISDMYSIGGPGIRQLANKTAKDIRKVKNDLKIIKQQFDKSKRNALFAPLEDVPIVDPQNETKHCCEDIQEIGKETEILQLSSDYGVVREWKFLVRHLGVSELDITEIVSKYTSPRDQAYQVLLGWKQNSSGLTFSGRETLINALRACHLNNQADRLVMSKDS